MRQVGETISLEQTSKGVLFELKKKYKNLVENIIEEIIPEKATTLILDYHEVEDNILEGIWDCQKTFSSTPYKGYGIYRYTIIGEETDLDSFEINKVNKSFNIIPSTIFSERYEME